jgi:hypothetical protein
MKMKSSNLLMFIGTLLLAAPIAFCQSDPVHGPPPGLASAPKLPVLGGKIAEISDDGLTIKTTQGRERHRESLSRDSLPARPERRASGRLQSR